MNSIQIDDVTVETRNTDQAKIYNVQEKYSPYKKQLSLYNFPAVDM